MVSHRVKMEEGQLYTYEGVAASMIILLTAYLVVNSTSLYTQGDTHISDMQLEVLGSDALRMMNTVPNISFDSQRGKSPLQLIVEQNDQAARDRFVTDFWSIVNHRVDNVTDRIQFSGNVVYRKPDNSIDTSTPLGMSRRLTAGEHAVRVSEWMIVDNFPSVGDRERAVLVEVLLWRD